MNTRSLPWTEQCKHNIKLVSFDLFDTLIFRSVGSPDDFFRHLAVTVLQNGLWHGNSEDFVTSRRYAEEKARKQKYTLEGHREVTLAEIYAAWPVINGPVVATIETTLEIDNWLINPIVLRWIEEANQAGKRIAFVSDMYLDDKVIKTFLQKRLGGIVPEFVLISSQERCSKHDGKLFLKLLTLSGLKGEQVLHIGDNSITDGQMARAFGINTFVQIMPNYFHCISKDEKRLSSSLPLLEAVRKTWLWQNTNSAFSTQLGGMVYGPFLWFMAHWLIKRCESLNIDTLICFMREGDIFSKVIHAVGSSEIKIKTLSISRRASFFPSIGYFDFDKFDSLSERRGYTLAECLEDLGVPLLHQWTNKKSTPLSLLISTPFWSELRIYIQSQKDYINEHLSAQKRLLLSYLHQEGIDNSSSLALWDWGCGASLFANIVHLINISNARFFMAYASNKSTDFSLNYHLETFIPIGHRATVLASSPEVSEILLNGHLTSTRAYTGIAGNVTGVPVLPKPLLSSELNILLNNFMMGIDSFLDSTKMLSVIPQMNVDNQHICSGILYRLVHYPQLIEAREIQTLQLPLTNGQSTPLINEYKVSLLRQKYPSAYQAFADLEQGLWHYELQGYWNEGALALAFPGCSGSVGELGITLGDEMVPSLLLSELRRQSLTRTAIYGAGELGARVVALLRTENIEISLVVDRRATAGHFELEGISVVTLQDAVDRGETVFTVASKAFASEISSDLSAYAHEKGIDFTIISILARA